MIKLVAAAVVSIALATPAVASAVGNNPLYKGKGTAGVNPIHNPDI